MKIKDLYDLMDKTKEGCTFQVYVDGISNNILAFCNSYYKVDGTTNGTLKYKELYKVSNLFECEVISFYPWYNGISVKIDKFNGMKYKVLESYIDNDKKEKYKDFIKIWNE